MDWTRPGRRDSFRYVRVAWPSMEEVGALEVASCEYTENALSALKVGGKAELPAGLDLGDDMIRAYSVSTLGGERAEVCHFTMSACSEAADLRGPAGSAQATLYSALKVLRDEGADQTLTVPEGADPVEEAARICRERHLRVSAAPYGRGLRGPMVFDQGTDYLSVVNGLLGAAGYSSAGVDAWGSVTMEPYVDPSGRPVAARVGEGGQGLLCSPSLRRSFDLSSVPNVVTVVGEDSEGRPLRAQARNDSPSSRWSTASRRKTVTRFERVDGVTTQAALDSKARALLREATMAVETVELTHFWADFPMGAAVEVRLPGRGLDAAYSATSRRVSMSPGMRSVTSARRFVDLEGSEWSMT